MPELPETETIARDLDRALTGSIFTAVTVSRPDVLRHISARALVTRLTGRRVLRSWRRAKLIVIDLAGGDRLVVQPRFTGALLLDAGDLPESERRFSTLALTLDDGRVLHYRDIRRLGTVILMSESDWSKYSALLGIEPLDPAFSASHLSAILRGSRQAIKKVLMDQRRVAGIGNIYANEALWRARIDPSRAARAVSPGDVPVLRDAIVSVLREAIAARGTSFRDYRDASGERGTFAEQLAVYGRGGLPCPRCGSRLVDTSAVDGRTTVFCSHCQR